MSRFKEERYLLCLALLFGAFLGLFGGDLAFAAHGEGNTAIPLPPGQEEPQPVEASEEKLTVFSDYPILENTVGSTFEFEVTLFLEASEPKTFDLDLMAPEGWTGVFRGGYPETEISAFTVEPGKEHESVKLIVGPSPDKPVGPGEYSFTLTAVSDDLSGSVDLKAVVVEAPPQYQLYLATSTLRHEFRVKPNQDNHVSLQLTNVQTGTVKDIIFTAEKPEGWDIVFTPSSLPSLESGVTQEIDMVIIPPSDAEAGDYPLNVKATGDKAEMEREFRITVVTSTALGAAGIGITVGVIVGLAIWFRRAGRR